MDTHVEIEQLAAEQQADDQSRVAPNSAAGGIRIGRMWVGHADAIPVGELETHALEVESSVSPETADKLKAAIDELPEQQREVVNLLFWERVTEREAAERLGISRRAIQTHRARALTRLRDVVGDTIPGLAEAS